MNERLRIPQDSEYFHAVGLATIAFARLEWNAVWCCEKLVPGYIDTIEKKTAGTIARDLESLFLRVVDEELRLKAAPYAAEFRRIVEDRNGLVHGKPGTTRSGDQRLFRHGVEWSIDAVNAFADDCVSAGAPLNDLLYAELQEAGSVNLATAASKNAQTSRQR